MSKIKEVKELFENTGHYFKYDYNLQIRKETVGDFTKELTFKTVLDMPSGNGAISLPLISKSDKLILIDVSANMLAIAKANIAHEDLDKVETINDDFFKIDFLQKKYDLIICLGLLAHVDSPEKLLQKLAHLVAPGGSLIIQNTDSHHFYAKLIRLYLGLKNILKKQTYALNKVPGKFVEETLQRNGLKLQKYFRYNQSFLGFSNLFSNEKKYRMTRNFFGNTSDNKHAKFGSDVTYLFKAD